ncbi:MAG TPA: sigma-70 family RNA polymerase sigma factor [Candidatus Binataceae bacterium]|nr:sigma-70 family RNA polymerase sigma factor [Candidatus Binataceae bacterium]
MPSLPFDRFVAIHKASIERLYAQSGGRKWLSDSNKFAEALYRSYLSRFGGDAAFPQPADAEKFLGSLHCEDLALAAGCLDGDEPSWRHFVSEYSGVIDGFARSVTNDPTRAQELADSLWADLYGLKETGTQRKSPLANYHGRSPLRAWLRTVMARREADTWRETRRLVPLEAIPGGTNGVAADSNNQPDPDRARLIPLLGNSLDTAIAALDPKDKLRLSYYYVQEITLAEIAAIMGEHESTVSRNLARSRTEIRNQVVRTLRREHRLSEDQINRCFEYAVEDWAFDLGRALSSVK